MSPHQRRQSAEVQRPIQQQKTPLTERYRNLTRSSRTEAALAPRCQLASHSA